MGAGDEEQGAGLAICPVSGRSGREDKPFPSQPGAASGGRKGGFQVLIAQQELWPRQCINEAVSMEKSLEEGKARCLFLS